MELVKVPLVYGRDWLSRYDGDPPNVEAQTARSLTIRLDEAALADMLDDISHYTDPVMRREFIAEGSGRIVRSADAAKARLIRQGVAL